MWIDSHAHLYLKQFDDDRNLVMERAQKAGVDKILLPDIDASTTESLWRMVEEYPGRAYGMSGLHPCSVNEMVDEQILHVQRVAEKRDIIAIGEIGLDYYWDKTWIDQQKKAYQIQMEYALERGKPIVIHSRDSLTDTISMAEPFAKRGLRGVFHCFNGTIEQMLRIQNMGFMMGLGGVISYKNAGLNEMVKEISLDHVILETDAPYLSPVPFRGKRNESSYIPKVAEIIQMEKMTSLEEISTKTTYNAVQLFSIDV